MKHIIKMRVGIRLDKLVGTRLDKSELNTHNRAKRYQRQTNMSKYAP